MSVPGLPAGVTCTSHFLDEWADPTNTVGELTTIGKPEGPGTTPTDRALLHYVPGKGWTVVMKSGDAVKGLPSNATIASIGSVSTPTSTGVVLVEASYMTKPPTLVPRAVTMIVALPASDTPSK